MTRARIARWVAITMLGAVQTAGAVDVPVDADFLQLRRQPNGREVLELVSRDPALGIPERRSADDPSLPGAAGAVLDLFGGDGSSATFAIPGGSGMPGWKGRDGRRQPPAYRYLNPDAPEGPSTVKLLVLRQGEGLFVAGRAAGLPLEGATGRVGVRLTLGDLRVCVLFDESTVVHDKPGRFAARDALAVALPDCSDASLAGLPATTTTTSTTATSSTSSSTSSSTTSSTSTSTSTSSTSSTSTSTTLPGATYGNAVEFSTPSQHSAGFLLGGSIQIPSAVTVTHLAVIAKAAGANVLLGLYRNSNGVPTTLVVGTQPTPLAPGRVEVPVPPTTVAAGRYWLMALYDADASVGMDTSVSTATAMYSFRDFAQGLPATVSLPASLFGQRYNYYLRATP